MSAVATRRGLPRSAIAIACRAPSVHNSQPWLWWIGDDVIQLHADMARWLQVTDGDGRDLLVSCGSVHTTARRAVDDQIVADAPHW